MSDLCEKEDRSADGDIYSKADAPNRPFTDEARIMG